MDQEKIYIEARDKINNTRRERYATDMLYRQVKDLKRKEYYHNSNEKEKRRTKYNEDDEYRQRQIQYRKTTRERIMNDEDKKKEFLEKKRQYENEILKCEVCNEEMKRRKYRDHKKTCQETK